MKTNAKKPKVSTISRSFVAARWSCEVPMNGREERERGYPAVPHPASAGPLACVTSQLIPERNVDSVCSAYCLCRPILIKPILFSVDDFK